MPSPKIRATPLSRLRNIGAVNTGRKLILSPEASSTELALVDESISCTEKQFNVIRMLGQGAFGVVKEVESKHSKERFALKVSKVDKLKVKSGLNYINVHLNEVRIHSSIPAHPSILHFHQAWKENGYVHLLLEICESSLDGHWKMMNILDPKEINTALIDMLMALKHLSTLNIAHLDVKPGNILRSHRGVYKLADFTVAVDLNKIDSKHDEFGDGKFAAPELLNGIFTTKADLFSLGMSLIQVSVPASEPLNEDEWSCAKNEGEINDRVTEALSEPLNRIIGTMIREYYIRPSVENILESFEPANDLPNVYQQMRHDSPIIKEHPGVTLHTDPRFFEMEKPNGQRTSLRKSGLESRHVFYRLTLSRLDFSPT